MAQRRTMYRGDRRRKEDQRKAKQEAKRARKADRRESGNGGPEIGEAASLQGSATEFVWFSPSSGRTVTTTTAAVPSVQGADDWTLLADPRVPPGRGADHTRLAADFLIRPPLQEDLPAVGAGCYRGASLERGSWFKWHGVRSSGSTMRRVMDSSRRRAARTCSCISMPFRRRASRASLRATRSSSR